MPVWVYVSESSDCSQTVSYSLTWRQAQICSGIICDMNLRMCSNPAEKPLEYMECLVVFLPSGQQLWGKWLIGPVEECQV